MTVDPPPDLEHYLMAEVRSGHFASTDQAIAAAVCLMRNGARNQAVSGKPLDEDAFERQLQDQGILSTLPSGLAFSTYRPVPIQGEPLSQSIIRERR
jgi:hypothetical protein